MERNSTLIFAFLLIYIFGFTNLKSQTFKEVTDQCGIDQNINSYGLAFGDFNQDGWDDLYATSRKGANRLYKNLGNGKFEEVGESTGLNFQPSTRTAVWFDINNDGHLDLYLGNDKSEDQLFLNDGNGSFQNITEEAYIFNPDNAFSINMADIDNDSYLDIYVSNFLDENQLYLNNGDNTFTNNIFLHGANDDGKSMGSLFFDYDKDGAIDLYLVHDGFDPNILYKNRGDGTFTDVSLASKANFAAFGMGVDAGDINNDGWMDLYITNLYDNALLLNNGDGTFSDLSDKANIKDQGMGWGVTFVDFDNDGWIDVYVCNDSYFSDYPNVLYRNNGDLTFTQVEIEENVTSNQGSYACICGDINLDGKMDLAVGNDGRNDVTQLFENQSNNNNHWIGFKLKGTISNSIAIGAKIQLVDNLGVLHYDEITGGNGFASQNSYLVHFGLGEATSIDSAFIDWPNGYHQSLTDLVVDTYWEVEETRSPTLFAPKAITTSVQQLINEPNFSLNISPNPASHQLNLSFQLENQQEVQLQLLDIHGKTIRQFEYQNLPIGLNQLSIAIEDLNAQLFILKGTIGNQSFYKKVLVQ